jgi:hypothetical protein
MMIFIAYLQGHDKMTIQVPFRTIILNIDATNAQATLDRVNNQTKQTKQEIEQTKIELNTLMMVGMHMMSLTLQNFSKVANVESLMAVQSVISGGITIARLGIQGAAAAASGNFLMAGVYGTMVGEMSAIQIQAIAQREAVKSQERYIASINLQQMRYS